MWPFLKKSRRKDAPPVDLDKPVANPSLLLAIEAMASEPGEGRVRTLVQELAKANYLVATMLDEADVEVSVPGAATFKKDSLIKVFEVRGPGEERALALFTDWDAIRKFTDKSVSGLVMPASQAWSFAARQYGNAVVNPAGPALPLNTAQVNELARISAPPQR
jgi:hypothetical protein